MARIAPLQKELPALGILWSVSTSDVDWYAT